MESVIAIIVLAVLIAGRLYAAKVSVDFIESLPAPERARIKRSLERNAY